MKIVMLGPFGLRPKGTMRARALPAARALVARGHAVHVLMPPTHTPEEAGRAWTDPSGVHIEYVSLGGLGLPGVGHWRVAGRLASRADAMAPDIVHAFKPKAYSGLAAALLRLRQRRGSRFGLVMDTDDWEGAGGWNDLEDYGPVMRAVFARQERWGLTHADAVTVASRALETLVWALGVPRSHVAYVPNALGAATPGGEGAGTPAPGNSGAGPNGTGDAATGTGARDAAGAGACGETTPGGGAGDAPTSGPGGCAATPLGGCAGSDGDASGGDRPPTILLYTRFFEFDLARPLEVLARVRQRHAGARLVVAGKGLFGEERAFLEVAASCGLGDAVDYRGWVSEEAAAALFATADVALYPFDDTLVNRAKSSVKVLELLGAGVPVVAEAVGELAAVIEDGRTGRLVAPGDVAALAAAVSDLLADPSARRAMGAATEARIRMDHHWSTRVADLESIYRLVLAGQR